MEIELQLMPLLTFPRKILQAKQLLSLTQNLKKVKRVRIRLGRFMEALTMVVKFKPNLNLRCYKK